MPLVVGRKVKRMEEKVVEDMPKVWFRPEEAGTYLGIGRTRIYGLLGAGEIPSVRIGRTRHIRRRNLDEYMERKFEAAPCAGETANIARQ